MPWHARRRGRKDIQSKLGDLLLAHTRLRTKDSLDETNKAENYATVSGEALLGHDPVGQHNL